MMPDEIQDKLNSEANMHPLVTDIGDLGSEYGVFRNLHSDIVTRLADGMDTVKMGFRKAMFDAKQGIVVLMSPSVANETTVRKIDRDIGDLCNAAGVRHVSLGRTRLRLPEEPKNTGIEPDCAFYIGKQADAYASLRAQHGEQVDAAADEFLRRNHPDLVVEVEVTHADHEKMERYRTLDIPEVWRTKGAAVAGDVEVTMYALQDDGYVQTDTSPTLGTTHKEIADLINTGDKWEDAHAQAVQCAVEAFNAHLAVMQVDAKADDSGLTP